MQATDSGGWAVCAVTGVRLGSFHPTLSSSSARTLSRSVGLPAQWFNQTHPLSTIRRQPPRNRKQCSGSPSRPIKRPFPPHPNWPATEQSQLLQAIFHKRPLEMVPFREVSNRCVPMHRKSRIRAPCPDRHLDRVPPHVVFLPSHPVRRRSLRNNHP